MTNSPSESYEERLVLDANEKHPVVETRETIRVTAMKNVRFVYAVRVLITYCFSNSIALGKANTNTDFRPLPPICAHDHRKLMRNDHHDKLVKFPMAKHLAGLFPIKIICHNFQKFSVDFFDAHSTIRSADDS